MATNYPGDLSSAIEMEDENQYGTQSGTGLRSELADLKKDLDALLAKAGTLTDRELREARNRIFAKVGDMSTTAREQLNYGVDITADYVKERPLQSMAIALGVGLLLGVATRR
jgi:ElaB/YqjD/DUF883 family membrane-anchored ribosome-binding protein